MAANHRRQLVEATSGSNRLEALESRLMRRFAKHVFGVARRNVGKQAIELKLYHAIAFTHGLLQTRPVEHLDSATTILDQTRALQIAGSLRDAFPAHAEHVGYQLLGHGQRV